jgi:homoserine kinase
MTPVTVRAPATTSNLGPAFDAMGLALDFGLVVHPLADEGESDSVETVGEGADALPTDARNLIIQTMRRALTQTGFAGGGVRLRVENNIPLQRGLGASAAATVAGLLLADALTGRRPDPDELVGRAATVEGHPDNAAPCVYGGLVSVLVTGGATVCLPISGPDALRVALCIPDRPLLTAAARGVLPASVPFVDAVFNVQRTAMLVGALATGRFDLLRVATEDRLHQPYRLPLVPEWSAVLDSATAAGSLGAFVSGAGSSIAAFCTADAADQVARAMAQAACEHGLPARSRVCEIEPRGAAILEP